MFPQKSEQPLVSVIVLNWNGFRPSYNLFLSAAIEGKASFIVSGDLHLLNLKRYQDIKTIKVRGFLISLREVEMATIIFGLGDPEGHHSYFSIMYIMSVVLLY